MKRALAVLLLLPALAATTARAYPADPLICIDPGAIHIGPYTVDPPLICLL